MMNACLCLQILTPAPGQAVAAGSGVAVRVQVALACGCPAGAGGRYDCRRFQIKAALTCNDGEPVAFELTPGSGIGELTGRMGVAAAGDYLLTIEAFDPESGMAGRAKTAFQAR